MPDLLAPKPPSASLTETVHLVMPGDANPLGTVFGGRVMQWVDAVAALAAQRHSRRIVVTAAIDAVAFRAPIRVGEYAVLRGWVNRTWNTSMEVEVTVDAEHPFTGERRRSVDAYLTFAALGEDGRTTRARPVQPQSEEEWQRYQAAEERRSRRLEARGARQETAG